MFTAQRISFDKARKLKDKNGILVDVRDPVAFRDGHPVGAVNMSLRQISSLGKHPKATPIILYSDVEKDPAVDQAANYLIQLGFTGVYSVQSTPTRSRK